MKYFVEDADYLSMPVVYDEDSLVVYAKDVYSDTEDVELLEEYNLDDLSDVDVALRFLNDRFSYDDVPFKKAVFFNLD